MAHPDGPRGLRESVREALDAGSRKIVLDLSGVTKMDSTGIGELAASLTTCARYGGRLKLLNPSPKPFDKLQISGLLRTFEIFHDEAEAIESFETELVGAGAN